MGRGRLFAVYGSAYRLSWRLRLRTGRQGVIDSFRVDRSSFWTNKVRLPGRIQMAGSVDAPSRGDSAARVELPSVPVSMSPLVILEGAPD
jgi:hypothetical protein